MPSSFEYRCQSCGEQHTGLPAWHFAAPAQAHRIAPEERADRIDLTEDGCTIDGREFYVKGLLEIPVRETTLRSGQAGARAGSRRGARDQSPSGLPVVPGASGGKAHEAHGDARAPSRRLPG